MIATPKTGRFGRSTVDLALSEQTEMMMESSSREREAILAGVGAADAALSRSRTSAVLRLFVRTEQSLASEPRLEVLRAYAELRRALLPQGRFVPATTLLAAGFTAVQIAQFDAMIAKAHSER